MARTRAPLASSLAAGVALLGAALTTALPYRAGAAPVPAAAAPAAAPDTAPVEDEDQPSEATAKVIQEVDDALRAAADRLPEGLKAAKGNAFFVAHVEAVAGLDAPAARTFARRLVGVLKRHPIKLPDTLAPLAAADDAPREAGAEPPLGREDNFRLAALVGHLFEPEDSPFKDAKEAEAANALFVDLAEACALHAPSALARGKAAVTLASTVSVVGSEVEGDEDLSKTWVAPARIARAWDAAFDYALDPAHGDGPGKLDPGSAMLLNYFDAGEFGSLYLVPHGLANDAPGRDVLTAPLEKLAARARATRAAVTDPAAKEILGLFRGRVGKLKELAAGDMTEGFMARPAVAKVVGEFVAAVNAGGGAALARVLTPEAAGAAAGRGELASDLFGGTRVKEVGVFFVAAPEKEEPDPAKPAGLHHLIFYLQAADAADGHPRYARADAGLVKTAAGWRLCDVSGVIEPPAPPTVPPN